MRIRRPSGPHCVRMRPHCLRTARKHPRWLTLLRIAKMVSGQRHEVDRLTEQVGRCRTVIDSILSLAEQLKEGTIERVLAKSDLELGVEFLLSKGKPHR